MKIPVSYYQSNDVVSIARELIGKSIYTNINDQLTGGVITETEAYAGLNDKASHAYAGRRTSRNEVMYDQGGLCYVYLCYGIHNLVNIVTGSIDTPHAILIRGIYSTTGLKTILKRTDKINFTSEVTNGPGKVSKALGIDRSRNGIALDSNIIWLEENNLIIGTKDIILTKRIGIDYAEEDADLLYRFILSKKLREYLGEIKKRPIQ